MKYGFIGTGNMGGALASAAAKSVGAELIALADHDTNKARTLADTLGAKCLSNAEIAQNSEYIFLGVKPQMLPGLLAEIAPVLKKRTDSFTLVTMAAGTPISRIEELLGKRYPTIRIMPNTPVSIGKGIILYCANDIAADVSGFTELMKCAGTLDEIPENLIDAASCITGCGPAWVYMFIEALSDGGVECGLPRAKAIRYACDTLIGSAELVNASGKHPGLLKDEVTSPGGTTIAGVHALENGGFRGTVMDTVKAAHEKTLSLKK